MKLELGTSTWFYGKEISPGILSEIKRREEKIEAIKGNFLDAKDRF